VLAKLMIRDCVITVKTVLAVIQNTLKTGQLSKLHQSILKYQWYWCFVSGLFIHKES